MKIIKFISLAFVFTFTSSIVNAQETVETSKERALKQTENLTNELSLTAAQQEQIYSINLGIIQKNDAIRNNTSMSAELKTESINRNNEARQQLIKKTLTPDQMVKFETMEKNQLQQKKQINKTIEKPTQKH